MRINDRDYIIFLLGTELLKDELECYGAEEAFDICDVVHREYVDSGHAELYPDPSEGIKAYLENARYYDISESLIPQILK